MDNFNLKKYLAESKLLKEEETYDIYGDGDVVIDISRATPEQERLIRWESDPENGITEFENSEDAQKFADEIMNLNSAKEVKNYYDNVRGWATVDYLSTSNALNAFVGNKQLNENAPGYDTRKFGEALPTLESVKAAHEAKEDDKEEIKEERFDGEREMMMHIKQYRDGMIDGDDLVQAFEEIINGKVTPPGYNTRYGR